jgi:hypothetical protein
MINKKKSRFVAGRGMITRNHLGPKVLPNSQILIQAIRRRVRLKSRSKEETTL